jgi:putative transposase
MRPYSEDLRERIIAAKQSGKSSAEVAEHFAVGQRTVERYWQCYQEKGHCRIGQIGGHRRPSLADHKKTLTAWITAQPDLTLEELCARCQKELKVTISVSGLWHRLKAVGLSYKKKDARRRAGSS